MEGEKVIKNRLLDTPFFTYFYDKFIDLIVKFCYCKGEVLERVME